MNKKTLCTLTKHGYVYPIRWTLCFRPVPFPGGMFEDHQVRVMFVIDMHDSQRGGHGSTYQ